MTLVPDSEHRVRPFGYPPQDSLSIFDDRIPLHQIKDGQGLVNPRTRQIQRLLRDLQADGAGFIRISTAELLRVAD